MVKMTEVQNSSAIGAHGYDPATRILSIHFKSAKKTHHYHDVSPDEAKAFAGAESLGKHHAAHIKGKYHHTTVDA